MAASPVGRFEERFPDADDYVALPHCRYLHERIVLGPREAAVAISAFYMGSSSEKRLPAGCVLRPESKIQV